MRNPRFKRTKFVSAATLLIMGQARADSSGKGFGEFVLAGVSATGITVTFAGTAVGTTASGASTPVLVVVGILAGLSGFSATGMTSMLKKELVIQLKIDHDSYLAGGEKTPFLEEIYRGVLLQTKPYSLRDASTGEEVMDEAKMTAAIDRLVAMVEPKP